ncbi:MAG: STAS domain-containing protein [Pseudomonadota bacterium]
MLVLPATLTNVEARDVLAMLTQAMSREQEPVVALDASALKDFDSAALAVLLECQRLAQASGKRFLLRQAPPKLNALAKLYGVDVLLPAAAH